MNTVRLKPETEERMRLLASRLGVTVSDIHRNAIDEYLARELKADAGHGDDGQAPASRWDSVIGVVEGKRNVEKQTGQRDPEPARKKRARHPG